jgi:N-acetylglucosamine-6-phosphate deacetylase
MLVFTAKLLLTPVEAVAQPRVVVDDGRIISITQADAHPLPAEVHAVDLGDSVIAPGYIDLHIHGSAGYDVMDDNAAALPAVESFLVRHGVTGYYPTTVTAPLDATLRALERLADAIEKRSLGTETDRVHAGACPLGIHLEGPFISHVRKGVHPAADLLPPKLETFERFWQAARGRIGVMTIAPELEGATELIIEAARRGVCVSLGHSDADFDSTERGVAAGARHATPSTPCVRSIIAARESWGAVLTDGRLSADIADGVHLDPAIVALVAAAKGTSTLCLSRTRSQRPACRTAAIIWEQSRSTSRMGNVWRRNARRQRLNPGQGGPQSSAFRAMELPQAVAAASETGAGGADHK